MQGIHQTTNFDVGGTTSFTDRQLRPHNHHLNNHQPLNCPRCDSLNTKFCYYNNYNLSQPRHFCKNCRRYWTNGGVLRNVPVGGGCRKSKRPSKTKVKNSASVSRKAVHMSHSSSESSSNNGAATSDLQANIFQGTVVTVPSNGEFMSLKNNDQDSTPTTTTTFNQFMPSQIDWELGKLNGSNGILTPTVRIDDLLENKGHYSGVTTLDWEHPTAANAHQGLFDFTTTADPQAYWTQAMSTVAQDDTHWSHHSLFLP